jgi:NADPH2:quinone reductase
LAKAETLQLIPDGLGFVEAVALVHDGRTAYAVAEHAAFQPGQRVLITAAGGGLGTLLTQLATSAGATVVAAARGERKLLLAAELGANSTLDYSSPDWTAAVDPVDAVLDGAGGEIGAASAGLLRPGGRFIGYGSAAGGFAEPGRTDIDAVSLFDITGGDADWATLGARALADVAAGRIRVTVGQTFPLDCAADAHAAIETRTAIGRTVLA